MEHDVNGVSRRVYNDPNVTAEVSEGCMRAMVE